MEIQKPSDLKYSSGITHTGRDGLQMAMLSWEGNAHWSTSHQPCSWLGFSVFSSQWWYWGLWWQRSALELSPWERERGPWLAECQRPRPGAAVMWEPGSLTLLNRQVSSSGQGVRGRTLSLLSGPLLGAEAGAWSWAAGTYLRLELLIFLVTHPYCPFPSWQVEDKVLCVGGPEEHLDLGKMEAPRPTAKTDGPWL